jgi:nucleoside-diphosphate-sugar epimerase
MIVGSGLMASAFGAAARDKSGLTVYASGVSNSRCEDEREFDRERVLLEQSLRTPGGSQCFVYFSTCSVNDPESAQSPYVRHKLRMEQMVRAHPNHLIVRLPQVAGHTPNPHTLLNYLYARVARGERFAVWANARRNIIDCDDVCSICLALIDSGARGETVNIANRRDYAMSEVVAMLETVCGGHAVYDVLDRGAAYPIDVARMLPFADQAGVSFDDRYLERVLRKYYGRK